MDTTLYTDGHGIRVTTSEFIAGKTSYRIDGIINAQMNILQSALAPTILFILIGFAAVITGVMHLYSNATMEPFYMCNILVTANRILILTGAVFLAAGLIRVFNPRNKYAVHIVTAKGDRQPVISTKKEYIREIVTAIQKARSLK